MTRPLTSDSLITTRGEYIRNVTQKLQVRNNVSHLPTAASAFGMHFLNLGCQEKTISDAPGWRLLSQCRWFERGSADIAEWRRYAIHLLASRRKVSGLNRTGADSSK